MTTADRGGSACRVYLHIIIIIISIIIGVWLNVYRRPLAVRNDWFVSGSVFIFRFDPHECDSRKTKYLIPIYITPI